MGSLRRAQQDEPMLITSVPESPDAEYARRKRKYAIMMGIRALCVLAAALTYQVSVFLTLAFIVGAVVLPWCAVVIANDRSPRRRVEVRTRRDPGANRERAITSGDSDRTVDG